MSETTRQGEYRRPNSQEIAQAVATFRKAIGMKQISLALEAGVVRYGVYTTEDNFRVSTLVFLPKRDDRSMQVKQLLVPRRFAEMAWASIR